MPKARVHNFSISLDGYAAGPDQSVDCPLGSVVTDCTNGRSRLVAAVGRTAPRAVRKAASTTSSSPRATWGWRHDHGRNMFGPIRGPWCGEDWTAWWGDNPRLFDDLDGGPAGYEPRELTCSPSAVHVRLARAPR